MKKKNLALVLSLVMIVSISGASITAYLFADKTVTNNAKVGYVQVSVDERGDDKSGITGFDEDKKLTKASEVISKPVRIKNEGSMPCYVRVWVGLKDESLSDNILFTQNTSDFYNLSEFKDDNLSNGWIYDNSIAKDGEGWYYYTEPVPVGGYSNYLFKQIKSDFVNDITSLSDLDIIVYSESVQTTKAEGISYEVIDEDGNVTYDYAQAWKDYLN